MDQSQTAVVQKERFFFSHKENLPNHWTLLEVKTMWGTTDMTDHSVYIVVSYSTCRKLRGSCCNKHNSICHYRWLDLLTDKNVLCQILYSKLDRGKRGRKGVRSHVGKLVLVGGDLIVEETKGDF